MALVEDELEVEVGWEKRWVCMSYITVQSEGCDMMSLYMFGFIIPNPPSAA